MRLNAIVPLTSEEIHLWFAFYDEIRDQRLLSACRQLLNTAEKEQETRFYFARDRHRYLITRALVRTVLSRYVPIDPKDWVFSTNFYGRPYIVNEEPEDACLSFNISHTHSLIVLAVTRQTAVGVDVENFRAREVSIEIAQHYFAAPEVAALAAAPPDQRQYRFFEYWTFKEAYIKARGMGLSLPLDKFSFHYPNDYEVEIDIHPELKDESARWQFWLLRPAAEYLLALCGERVGSRPRNLTAWRAVPTLGEQKCAFEILRASK
jgi:4'-phosphopantetheinyl transferase